jgi:hypothetical protein
VARLVGNFATKAVVPSLQKPDSSKAGRRAKGNLIDRKRQVRGRPRAKALIVGVAKGPCPSAAAVVLHAELLRLDGFFLRNTKRETTVPNFLKYKAKRSLNLLFVF